MMTKQICFKSIGVLLISLCTMTANAQIDTGNQTNKKSFRERVISKYTDFRRQCVEEYIQFMRQAWNDYGGQPAEQVPKIKEVPPIEYKEDIPDNQQKEIPLPFDKVIIAEDDYVQPMPLERIPEVPIVKSEYCLFTFYGAHNKVRIKKNVVYKVKGTGENQVADAMQTLSSKDFDNTIIDCLKIREDMQLGDWAYLLMLRQMSEQLYGKDTNEAILLSAYIYIQSGYKVRLASDASRLYLLVASKHRIYGKDYYELDGERYYSFEDLPMSLKIGNVSFPKEKSLSLVIPNEQKFIYDATEERTITSSRYPEVSVTLHSNKNLLDFYGTYPTSDLGENFVSRWAIYANTPLQSSVKEQIYPSLKRAIQDCGEHEAVEKLLNFVQTGFVYKYDDEVWGEDRAFFAEETLFYPYSDCEDRSILFTRLVRDLVGLDCILVYYPGHLASAVCFTEEVKGDYINLDGRRFTIADPTYLGASVGRTMPNMDNQTATVILLKDK